MSEIATVIIAVATIINIKITSITINRVDKQISQTEDIVLLQREYNNNTIRPFVYIDSLRITHWITPNDTSTFIRYRIKNSGLVPAKNMKHKMDINNEKLIDFDLNVDSSNMISKIYPRNINEVTFRGGFIDLNTIINNQYLYFHVVYDGINKQHYYFKNICYFENPRVKDNSIYQLQGYLVWF